MPGLTRVEAGRRRALVAKRTVAVTAAAAFAVALALVREGHPAAATSSSTHTGSSSGAQSRVSVYGDDGQSSTFGGGSIAPPSNASPSIVTSTS